MGKGSPSLPPRGNRSNPPDGAGFAGSFIASDILIVLRSIRLRHEHIHLLSDDFFARIAEYPFSRWVEQHDPALTIDGQDRVLSRVDETLEPGYVAPDFFQGAVVLDHLRNQVRHSLQKMNVVLRKLSRLCGMRSKDAERPIAGSNNDTHPAYHCVITQQRWPAKSLFCPKICNNHRLLAKQRIAGL